VRDKGVKQDQQQALTERPTRPLGAIENAMIILKMPILAQSHHRQNRRDGALPWRQQGPNYQYLSMIPNCGSTQRRKLRQESCHFGRQVEHSDPRQANAHELILPLMV
jgi:hypothetical protein